MRVRDRVSTSGREGVLRRRTVVTAALVATAALLVPSPALAGPGRNHAPSAPTALRVGDGGTACADGRTAVVVRSTAPQLRATLADPDEDIVSGTFTLRDGARGTRLWGPATTAPQGSGADHAVQVPEGVLRDGGTYEWRVQARDARGRKSTTVRCRFTVDVSAPAAPEVSAVAGTAPAVYLEDQTAGGVGQAGEFRLDAQGATDVVAFLVTFLGGPRQRVELPVGATSATVTWTPSVAGPGWVTAQAVDAAGNVSPERFYRFTVASAPAEPAGAARWHLDEGTGTVATDEGPSGAHLTLTPSTTWTDGLLAELAGMPEDRALLFDEASDGATTAAPVVDPTRSWSVLALVRADAHGAFPAVSQDGLLTSAFRLGTRTDGCADGAPACWAFTVSATLPGNPRGQDVVARSTVPVVPGEWVLLAGVRDAGTGTVRVDVCRMGSADGPADGEVVTGSPTALGASAAAAGPLRLGASQNGQRWLGAVSGVRTYGGVVDVTDERRVCAMGA